MAQVNITIALPALPDNDIWWANNAAWQEYWNGSSLTINIDAATTGAAGVVFKANTIAFVAPSVSNADYYTQSVDGIEYTWPFRSNYDQLKAAFSALLVDHVALKNALATAGIITNA